MVKVSHVKLSFTKFLKFFVEATWGPVGSRYMWYKTYPVIIEINPSSSASAPSRLIAFVGNRITVRKNNNGMAPGYSKVKLKFLKYGTQLFTFPIGLYY